jgi:hypothetical protein
VTKRTHGDAVTVACSEANALGNRVLGGIKWAFEAVCLIRERLELTNGFFTMSYTSLPAQAHLRVSRSTAAPSAVPAEFH